MYKNEYFTFCINKSKAKRHGIDNIHDFVTQNDNILREEDLGNRISFIIKGYPPFEWHEFLSDVYNVSHIYGKS